MNLVLHGRPITKKNHQQIVTCGGRPRIIQAQRYKEYAQSCTFQIGLTGMNKMQISSPVNLRCVYYMPTRHKVDLVNLLEATCDILVGAGVLADDNSNIIAAHDGCRVAYDKYDPRVEITIEPLTNTEV